VCNPLVPHTLISKESHGGDPKMLTRGFEPIPHGIYETLLGVTYTRYGLYMNKSLMSSY